MHMTAGFAVMEARNQRVYVHRHRENYAPSINYALSTLGMCCWRVERGMGKGSRSRIDTAVFSVRNGWALEFMATVDNPKIWTIDTRPRFDLSH